jgi:GTP-binding protein
MDFEEVASWSGSSEAGSAANAPNLSPLFAAILDHIPPPPGNHEGPFQMLVSTLDFSPYVGRIAIGLIERGTVKLGDQVTLLPIGEPGMVADGEETVMGKVAKLYEFAGLERLDLKEARAGDIVALAGMEGVEIGTTLTDPAVQERLLGIAVEEPTLSIDFSVNNSPFSGRSGKFVTSRQLRDRLFKELERNLALRVEETASSDTFTVSGRGELHLTILMETIRREGYEFQVSRPRVITRIGPDGQRQEPHEEVVIEVPDGTVGVVMEKMGSRGASMEEMRPNGRGATRLKFRIATRGLFGYRSEFLSDTRGEGMLHHRFLEYGPWAGNFLGRKRGVMVADREGFAVGYAIFNLQERATMFVTPGDPVYNGMIVGEYVRPGDVDVNICKEKKASNVRTTSTDENIKLEPPRLLTLELAMEFIEPDELIEITPDAMRLRKRELDMNKRRKAVRAEKYS